MKYKLFYCLLFISLFIISCTEKEKKNVIIVEDKTKIEGIYDYYTTGNGFECESVKHIIELTTYNKYHNFLYHVFCNPFNGDSTGESSLLKPYSMIGKWDFIDTPNVIRLVGDNNDTVIVVMKERKINEVLDTKNNSLFSSILFYHKDKKMH